MGGSGTRLGADIPKQYIELENRPIFSYIVEAHQNCGDIDKMVIVSHENWLEYVHKWVGWLGADKVAEIVAGGENRSASVRNGLKAMESWAGPEDVVLIHDATHPYCDEAGIRKVVEAVKKHGGATLAQPEYDTVYQCTGEGFVDKVLPRQLVISGAVDAERERKFPVLLERAEAVAGWLETAGISKTRIKISYKGSTESPYDTPEKNRVAVCIVK